MLSKLVQKMFNILYAWLIQQTRFNVISRKISTLSTERDIYRKNKFKFYNEQNCI